MSAPTRLRAVVRDGFTIVKLQARHVMETGRRKDGRGLTVAAHYVTELVVSHNDRVVMSAAFGPSVSRDPYLSFSFVGGAPGDRVSVAWVDNRGDARSDVATIG
ncbi:MAG: thiosulfate oxidation carrier complex protein SoxZ [Rhodocyclaceae bacterium]|nr:thiosulfate oxidation carrier complex protein SoxZ [Rhodocyclaceae bacterium]